MSKPAPDSRSHREFVPEAHIFSDDEARDLLRALYCWVEYYDWTDNSISSLAADIAMSLDRTNDADVEMQQAIEARFPDA